jgi:hypothetical protein
MSISVGLFAALKALRSPCGIGAQARLRAYI